MKKMTEEDWYTEMARARQSEQIERYLCQRRHDSERRRVQRSWLITIGLLGFLLGVIAWIFSR